MPPLAGPQPFILNAGIRQLHISVGDNERIRTADRLITNYAVLRALLIHNEERFHKPTYALPARVDLSSFCSRLLTLLQGVSRKIPAS